MKRAGQTIVFFMIVKKICRCLNFLKFNPNISLHYRNKSYTVQTFVYYQLKSKHYNTIFWGTDILKDHKVYPN